MRAVVIDQFNSPPSMEHIPDPVCPDDGVIVRVDACGVCRSDWHAWKGMDPDVTVPHVPGHEFAGVVVESGRDCSVEKGTRVTAPFILGCGHCPDCTAGNATVCDQQRLIGFTEPGAFAEYLAVPHAAFNLVPLPPWLETNEAAAMGCRLTTAYQALVGRAALQPVQWLAVHGCGGVGLSCIMLAQAIGARVIAVDINNRALELARSLGAEYCLNAHESDSVAEAIVDLTGGGADVSIEALGLTETFHNSLACLAKRGRHVQIGLPTGQHAEPTLPLLDLVYARQLTIMGTRGLPAMQFRPLLDLIERKQLDTGSLVTRTLTLHQVPEALMNMDRFEGCGISVATGFA